MFPVTQSVCCCLFCFSYLKAVLSRGDVDCSQVDHVPELGAGVVPQESQNGDHSVRMDHDLQLIVTSHLHTQAFSEQPHAFENNTGSLRLGQWTGS